VAGQQARADGAEHEIASIQGHVMGLLEMKERSEPLGHSKIGVEILSYQSSYN
jgi:hypothetical protein